MRNIKYIVIHCSAGFGSIESVKKYWKDNLGWRSPGYHFFIDEDGTVHRLSPISKITNGVQNHNKDSIHICYKGGIDKVTKKAKDTRTQEQKDSILKCILEVYNQLKETQPVDNISILGHRDFSPDKNNNDVIDPNERIKECPSFDAIPEYRWITVNSKNQFDKNLPE